MCIIIFVVIVVAVPLLWPVVVVAWQSIDLNLS